MSGYFLNRRCTENVLDKKTFTKVADNESNINIAYNLQLPVFVNFYCNCFLKGSKSYPPKYIGTHNIFLGITFRNNEARGLINTTTNFQLSLILFSFQILGIVVVGLVSHYFNRYQQYSNTPEVFFLLMAVTFLVGTFLILTSCLISISTASIISKTIYVSI